MKIWKKLFTKKKKIPKKIKKFYDKFLEKNFPEGQKQIDSGIKKVRLLSNNKLSVKESSEIFLPTLLLYKLDSKNKDEIIEYIMKKSSGKLINREANLIFLFIVCHNTIFEDASPKLQSKFAEVALNPAKTESSRKELHNKIEKTGCDSDTIPGGYGDFGYQITNPIPVNGIESNDIYLSRLRTSDNEQIKWRRTGPCVTNNIDNIIDKYKIYNINKEYLCDLYISPYHKKISEKAPKGFKLIKLEWKLKTVYLYLSAF